VRCRAADVAVEPTLDTDRLAGAGLWRSRDLGCHRAAFGESTHLGRPRLDPIRGHPRCSCVTHRTGRSAAQFWREQESLFTLAGFTAGCAGNTGTGRRPSSRCLIPSSGWRNNMRGPAQRITTRTLFTHRRAITMHHAIGTGRFGIAKHATGKMARCLLRQGTAVRAQPHTAVVDAVVTMSAAIPAHHQTDGLKLVGAAHAAFSTGVGNILEGHEGTAIRRQRFSRGMSLCKDVDKLTGRQPHELDPHQAHTSPHSPPPTYEPWMMPLHPTENRPARGVNLLCHRHECNAPVPHKDLFCPRCGTKQRREKNALNARFIVRL